MSAPVPPGPRLVLASASPRRRELLALLDLPFAVVPSAYEEDLPDEHPDPPRLARELALAKALDVVRSGHAGEPPFLVLGADTIVALGKRVFGKPEGEGGAREMIRSLAGQTHLVTTGVALVPSSGEPEVFAVSTAVRFRPLEEAEITAYVARGESADKAGGYASQGYGSLLIECICGEHTNVVGLPLPELAVRLRGHGLRVLGLPEG